MNREEKNKELLEEAARDREEKKENESIWIKINDKYEKKRNKDSG